MPITFPTPTSIGQQFSASGKTWQWNGFAWDSIANTAAIGATGATGISGSNGATGATGPAGFVEQKQLAKAWVNFDGSNSADISGTYVQSGTTVTVTTSTNHGLTQDQLIRVDITSGTALDATVSVNTVLSPTSFTYNASSSLTTSGNVTLFFHPIRSSYNVSSVTRIQTGAFAINFTTPMIDANYSFAGSADNNRYVTLNGDPSINFTRLTVISSGGSLVDATYISAQIFGN